MRSWGLGKRRKREGWITLWKICVGQVGRFCVFDVHQCQLPRRRAGRSGRALADAVHAKDYVLQLWHRRCIP